MSLPIERCVLQCFSQEGYTTVLAKPVGEFSLVDALREQYESLSLNQILDETAAYPCMRVVDLTPLTSGSLTDTATCIVLPPTSAAPEGDERVAAPSADAAIDLDVLVVQLQPTLRDTECFVDRRTARDALLLPADEGLFTLAGDITSCTFLVRVTEAAEDTGDDSATPRPYRLLVGAALFRNLRRVVCQSPAPLAADAEDEDDSTTPVPLHFGHHTMVLPVEALALVEDEAGNPAPLATWRTSSLCLQSLQLAPALDDFALTNTIGEGYFDMLSTLVALAAEQLDGTVVSVGDVVLVRLDRDAVANLLLRDNRAAVDGVDVLEVLYAQLQHGVEKADGVWMVPGTRTGRIELQVPLRVAGFTASASASARTFGLLSVGGGGATAVSLISPATVSASLDNTPIYAPTVPLAHSRGGRAAFPGLETFRTLVGTLALALAPSTPATSSALHVLVVHGIKENMPYEMVAHALARFGLRGLCVSVDALDAAELETVMERFLSGTCSHHAALVVKNAQNLLLDKRHLLSLFDGGAAAGSASDSPHGLPQLARVVVLVCESLEAVPPSIAARATSVEGVIECGNPSETDRRALLEWLVDGAVSRFDMHRSLLLSTTALAAWTVGLPLSEIVAYAEECFASALQLLPCGAGVTVPATRAVVSDTLCEDTLQRFLKSHGHNLVSTKLQPVRWSDVGGLEDAKRELRETIQLPMLHPELFANGMKKRTGILFYGPPGCGKTLLAKAVATEMNMNFMSVKGPELINQYVGESEKNIRLLFQKARDNSPCIVFFDELDALVPARGAKGDAGGAMDRIVSQLLVEVDGVGQKRSDGTASGDVFIIGATNRPDLLDPSLLRPGRFDRLCYLGMPSTKEEQLYAVKALTRKFDLHKDVDLPTLIAPLDVVYTGADFFALCSDAMMFAVEESLELVRAEMEAALAASAPEAQDDGAAESGAKGGAGDDDDAEDAEGSQKPIQVTMTHFVRARDQLKPSVTKDDLRRYESLRTKFSGP